MLTHKPLWAVGGKKSNKQRGFLSNICLSQNAPAFLAQ
jgi:hypothetical protein